MSATLCTCIGNLLSRDGIEWDVLVPDPECPTHATD